MKSRFSGARDVFKPGAIIALAAITTLTIVAIWLAHHSKVRAAEGADIAPTAPVVTVVRVGREDLFNEVTIPAEFRPYEEVVLHAKVSGYVSRLNVDFGDKVKAGQLLATLEVPELQAELVNAQAAEQKAEADYTNAHLIHTRLKTVNQEHPNLVAQQDLDTAFANDATAAAAIAAAKANVEKLQSMVSYTHITAPFDGVITHRYVDPGTLIQAGTASDTQSLPLVRVSDNYRLRLDFPVSVDYVQDVEEGAAVTVCVESDKNKTFTGKITRFTRHVDEATRTMTVEIEVPNPDLELVPGMYATVVLEVEKYSQVLTVPVEAVAGEKSPTVLIVNRDNQVEERPIKKGMETPDKYEVLSGLQEGDMVVVGNRSALQTGQKIEPKLLQLSLRSDN